MLDFCIIGSGISGSTIAKLLSKNYSVLVLDKARGPGGRASNKRLKKNESFDHGLQYISPKSQEFKKFIHGLYKKNILKIWGGNHIDFSFKKQSLSAKYIGLKGNNAISKFNLKKIKQHYNASVKKILFRKNYWELRLQNNKIYNAKSIILTCPFPQIKSLVKNQIKKDLLKAKIKMDPNITLMIAIKQKKILPISSIKLNDEIIAWIAYENSKKRFRSSRGLWTIQSTSSWAKNNINLIKKNKRVENFILKHFLKLTGFKKKDILFKKSHGWRYSYNFEGSKYKSYWDKKKKLGICADWFIGGNVEASWKSALNLFYKVSKA